eukprot:1825263-Rhodomonas_salina.2
MIDTPVYADTWSEITVLPEFDDPNADGMTISFWYKTMFPESNQVQAPAKSIAFPRYSVSGTNVGYDATRGRGFRSGGTKMRYTAKSNTRNHKISTICTRNAACATRDAMSGTDLPDQAGLKRFIAIDFAEGLVLTSAVPLPGFFRTTMRTAYTRVCLHFCGQCAMDGENHAIYGD